MRRVAAAALAAALLPVLACSEPAPPTVLLISLDSVRADALTFLDPEAAPNLAALAERGTIFTQAVSGSSWTLPAHAELFTGNPPALHGAQLDDVALDPLMDTLPELFQRGGWYTAGAWTGWYLAGDYGFGRGFDVYMNAMTGGERLDVEFRQALDRGDLERARQVVGGRRVASHRDVTSAGAARRFEEALSFAEGRPLFGFLHLFDPHYDYVPPAPWDTRFDPGYRGDLDGRDYYENTRVFDLSQDPPRRISDRDLAHVVALYRGEIGWTDENLGRVLAALDEDGRLDDAFIVVTADHGEEFFEHGGRGHRHTLYDELLRVPLLIVPPRGAYPDRPARWDGQVELADVLPTLLAHAGLDAPADVRGRSLLPVLRGATLPERPALSSLIVYAPGADGRPMYQLKDAIRTPREKLIRSLERIGSGAPSLRLVQYYDLARDPLEQDAVTDPADPRVQRLWTRLEDELDALRAAWSASERTPPAARATRINELFRDELGALGYGGATAVDGSPGLSLPWGVAPPPRQPPP